VWCAERDVAGARLPPVPPRMPGQRIQILDPPVARITPHARQQLVPLGHFMILLLIL